MPQIGTACLNLISPAKKTIILIVIGLMVSSSLYAQSASSQINARAEVAAVLYNASATQAAAERAADETIRHQRIEIDSLRISLNASTGENTQLQLQLTEAEERFVATLAERDRTYAREIAVFRDAVEDIASTPEGAAALARFNAGDEVGALQILDELRAARDAARQAAMNIESAAEGRRIATLALEARTRGKVTTEDVIARFEEVTQLDPGVHWDWIELGRLYTDVGDLDAAGQAARRSAETAEDRRDQAAALDALGDVQRAQGDLPGALASYQASKEIFEQLAERDPGNAGWQRDVSVSLDKVGDVQVAQGDLPGALASYEASKQIAEQLAERDPGNAGWQRDVSISPLNKVGNVQVAQGDLPGALASYQASKQIREQLAERDPGNAGWQRDVSVSLDRVGDVQVAQGDLPGALASYQASKQIAEQLAERDPGNAEWQRDVSVSLNKVGDVQRAQGELPGALASYQASKADI